MSCLSSLFHQSRRYSTIVQRSTDMASAVGLLSIAFDFLGNSSLSPDECYQILATASQTSRRAHSFFGSAGVASTSFILKLGRLSLAVSKVILNVHT